MPRRNENTRSRSSHTLFFLAAAAAGDAAAGDDDDDDGTDRSKSDLKLKNSPSPGTVSPAYYYY